MIQRNPLDVLIRESALDELLGKKIKPSKKLIKEIFGGK